MLRDMPLIFDSHYTGWPGVQAGSVRTIGLHGASIDRSR